MKYLKKIEGVKYFFLLKGEEVVATAHNLQIGDLTLDAAPDDDVFCENDVLIKREHFKKQFTYKNGKWIEDHPRYGYFQYFSENLYYSRERNKEEQLMRYSIIENGKETLFEIKSELGLKLHNYIEELSIYIFPEIQDHSLLFYTKDLQFLWKYQIEEPNVKILQPQGYTIVGDIVLIVRRERLGMTDFKFSMDAFCIRSGKHIWGCEDLDFLPMLRIASDNMAYSIHDQVDGQTFICKIDPTNGDLTKHEIKSDKINSKTEFSSLSTIDHNVMYVIIESPKPSLCSINLETMELEECQELETAQGIWLTEAPIVTEDKIYLFIPSLEELHILQR